MDSLVRRGELSIVAKIPSFGKGEPKKRCDQAAGASGAGPAEAVASSALTPPRIVWRASESSATPKLAFAAWTAARASLGVSREPQGGPHAIVGGPAFLCQHFICFSKPDPEGCGIDRLAVGGEPFPRLAGFWMNQRPSILDVRTAARAADGRSRSSEMLVERLSLPPTLLASRLTNPKRRPSSPSALVCAEMLKASWKAILSHAKFTLGAGRLGRQLVFIGWQQLSGSSTESHQEVELPAPKLRH